MKILKKAVVRDLACLLSKVCSDDALADLIDIMLVIEDNDAVTNYESKLGVVLFDALTDLRPDCVELVLDRAKHVDGDIAIIFDANDPRKTS